MTWALWTHKGGRHTAAPQLDLRMVYWRMTSPSGKTLTCALYRTAAGLEVRCDYGGDDLIRSQFARDLETAGDLAATWKTAALTRAGFVEREV